MSDDPKELIPKGPGRFRTVTSVPIVFALILVLSVAGAVLWNSLHKKKTSQVSPEQKSKDAVTQSKNDSEEPDYLNYGRFTKAGQKLPPNVPDLSGGKKAGDPQKLAHSLSSAVKPAVPGNILPAPPPVSSGGGLFVGAVDGGFDSSGSRENSPLSGPRVARPVTPGDLASSSVPGSPGGGKPTAYDQTNMQTEKDKFLSDSRKRESSDILENAVASPVSPFEIQAGTFIHAELVTGIDSDLPGEVTAQVTGNLYDSINERFLLVPQGSKLVGKYDSKVSVGQTRVLMAWERIIFPDGRSIDLSGMEGVDLEGYAGFHDIVDNHYLKIFGNAILMSLVMAGAQMSQPGGGYGMGGMNSFSNPTMGQVAVGSVGQNMSQTMEQYLGNTMNIQPTLKIRPGYRFDITVTKDMVFPGPYLVKGD